MSILDNIRDENGQIKKPILFSIIGAGGLLAYMFLSNRGSASVVATGQNTGLTPDLSGLTDAIKNLGSGAGGTTTTAGGGSNTGNTSGGGGGTGSGPSLDPPPTSTGTGGTTSTGGGTTYTNTPSTPVVSGSSGAQGGGGGGTGQVITPIAKDPTVYGGLATAILPVASGGGPKSVAYKPGGAPVVSEPIPAVANPVNAAPTFSPYVPPAPVYTPTVEPTVAVANPRAAAPTFSPYVPVSGTVSSPPIATSNPKNAAPSFSPYVPPAPVVSKPVATTTRTTAAKKPVKVTPAPTKAKPKTTTKTPVLPSHATSTVRGVS